MKKWVYSKLNKLYNTYWIPLVYPGWDWEEPKKLKEETDVLT